MSERRRPKQTGGGAAPGGTPCASTVAEISAYLDGDLPAAECARIERHCEGCPRCAALVAGLRETIGLCRRAGHAPLPEDVRARARARLQRLLAGGGRRLA